MFLFRKGKIGPEYQRTEDRMPECQRPENRKLQRTEDSWRSEDRKSVKNFRPRRNKAKNGFHWASRIYMILKSSLMLGLQENFILY